MAFLLRGLGTPSLLTASGEQVRFRTRKHFALLVRLALEPGKRFTRDYLTDLLWPTVAPRLALHSLAQGLSVIKAKVAREAVLIQRASVALAPGWVEVDVHHLSDGDVEIAGPFLDGFEIPAARPFEDWKDESRGRLLPQLRDCLARQMDAARRIGDYATVERRAARLAELDPLAEEAIRGVMEARAWAGDRSNALKAFARYEAQLADELGAKPGADLVRMADLLRDGRRSAPRPVAPGEQPVSRPVRPLFEPETLVGRETEFSALYDAWLEVRRKVPRIVVLTGDPGVGKTTLTNAFVSSCQMDGAVVARAQAYDAERELPFAILGELVKQLASQRAIGGADPEALSELTRITSEIIHQFPGVPKPVDWSPEITPLRLADAFLKTITAAAEESPIVLVVDDVHAADNASTGILHVVARKLAEVRVLMILTGRTSELRLSDAPAALTSDAAIESLRPLELDVLTPDAATRLVGRLTSGTAGAAGAEQRDVPTERLLRACGGNPLAIELLTREWTAHGPESLLRDLEALNTQPVPVIGIPRAIGAVFERQIRRLPPTTRAALDLAAVLGRRLTDLGLYAAVDLTPSQAAEALSRLKDEGLLREVRADLEFRNELIRAQAYYAVAGPARQHLHRRVGELLAGRQADQNQAVSLEIAWHFLRGGEVQKAVPFAHEGAEAFLAVGAPHEAEEILKAVSDADQCTRACKRTRLLLAKALLDQSKADAALPIVEGLVDDKSLILNEQAIAAQLHASAEYGLNREPGDRYCEIANRAVAMAKQTGDPALIARALFEYARAGTEAGLRELVWNAQLGIEELGKATDVDAMPVASLTKGFCSLFFLQPRDALSTLSRTVELNGPRANAAQLSFIHSGIGLAHYFLCNFVEAHRMFVTGLDLARRVGDDVRASSIASNLCTVQMIRGDYADAIRYGELSVALGVASSRNYPVLVTSYTNLADAYVLSGRNERALECMESAAVSLGPERRWKIRCAFLLETAAFALIQGNLQLALDLAAQVEALGRGREDAMPMPGPYWKLRIFRAAHLGNAEEASSLAGTIGTFFSERCPYYYLDILGVKAWLEQRSTGQMRPQTEQELCTFEAIGAPGKRALLVAQGFLPLP
jgi:DNA-binding SARP family transcriptional activator/tetratricopeptide (TPR) repeat protein